MRQVRLVDRRRPRRQPLCEAGDDAGGGADAVPRHPRGVPATPQPRRKEAHALLQAARGGPGAHGEKDPLDPLDPRVDPL
eukprot:2287458-Pyramimonas_sp.AAC.1